VIIPDNLTFMLTRMLARWYISHNFPLNDSTLTDTTNVEGLLSQTQIRGNIDIILSYVQI